MDELQKLLLERQMKILLPVDIPMQVLPPDAWAAANNGILKLRSGLGMNLRHKMLGGDVSVNLGKRLGESPTWNAEFNKNGLKIGASNSYGSPMPNLKASYTKYF
jgi:hypothetical protein